MSRRLFGCLAVLALVMVAGAAAAPDRKPPRIVAAVMVDADRDSQADRVRLAYSERVRHAADKDGKYPFAVAGYRIRSVIGKTIPLAVRGASFKLEVNALAGAKPLADAVDRAKAAA